MHPMFEESQARYSKIDGLFATTHGRSKPEEIDRLCVLAGFQSGCLSLKSSRNAQDLGTNVDVGYLKA